MTLQFLLNVHQTDHGLLWQVKEDQLTVQSTIYISANDQGSGGTHAWSYALISQG